MLATATGNCAVTNLTYNENKYYVVTWTVYLESSMYLRRCHSACWFRSGAVLKFDQFYHSSFETKLRLVPGKCTFVKVIDLCIMVLWSIGFIANRHPIPPTKLACVRYCHDIIWKTHPSSSSFSWLCDVIVLRNFPVLTESVSLCLFRSCSSGNLLWARIWAGVWVIIVCVCLIFFRCCSFVKGDVTFILCCCGYRPSRDIVVDAQGSHFWGICP